MPIVTVTITIAAPIERVFDLARRADLHETSMHRYAEKVMSDTPVLLELGNVVTFRATHFGIRQTLSSRITRFTFPTYFQDTMVSGIFDRLVHDHFFETIEGGTCLTDRFDYTAPLGRLGRLADWLFLERYMRHLLEERQQAIKSAAEADVLL